MQPNRPPEPHTPAWCALNPHRCKGDNVPSVPIDIGYYQLGIVLLILIVVYRLQIRIKNQISKHETTKSKSKEAV